jgi:DNA-binding MarR family transcriptional regulator
MSSDTQAPSKDAPPVPRPDLPRVPAALTERLGFLVAKTHAIVHAIAEETLAPLDLHVKEYAGLNVLYEAGPLSQHAVGAILGVDRTTMVAVVDELERKGLVERGRNPDDRRAYALAITDDGVSTMRRARRLLATAERRFVAPLSPAEVEQLRDLLARLIRQG